MNAFLKLGLAAAFLAPLSSSAQTLYRSVDENGKVIYSDRPQKGDEKGSKPKTPNVESPEATRQMREQLMNRQREEAADRMAQQRRAMGANQQEYIEQMRRHQLENEQHPERAPRPIQIVPVYR